MAYTTPHSARRSSPSPPEASAIFHSWRTGKSMNSWPYCIARPHARLHENRQRTRKVINTMFSAERHLDKPLSLHVSGTNFQISVWKALLQIPPAKVVSYTQVANAIGHPRSARAVGLAVGA